MIVVKEIKRSTGLKYLSDCNILHVDDGDLHEKVKGTDGKAEVVQLSKK